MAKKRRTELDMDRDFLAEEPVAPPKDEKPPPPPPPPEEKRPKKKINKVKLLIVAGSGIAATTLTVALVWLAISFFGAIAERKHAPPPPPPAQPEEPTPIPLIAPIYALEPFFIPLREKGSAESKLVKIQFALEMTSPETQRDMDRNITLIRENIYFMLQGKAKGDFTGKERLEKLTVDVAIAVNRSLQSGGVTRVWITDILIN
jgi:flagellar basal body-associated protein FliL